jgi:hypothetical protein
MDIIEFNLVEHNKNKWYVDSCVIKHVARGWKLGKVNKKSSYFQSSQKMVKFLTKLEESRLKIIKVT